MIDSREIPRSLTEPLRGLGEAASPYQVYGSIYRSFVAPRLDPLALGSAIKTKFSCLLYGPPGTGKTTIAQMLARALGWSLIIITPSDFVVSGEAEVESRAKAIFDVLQLQTDVVIFLDEIDRLLLDRDSADYQKQSDMFQFMTPSMLTKLNDLRGRRRSIFVIATNYADRIDNAITRPGRIDAQYLVLPPDAAQRTRLLTHLAGARPPLRDINPKDVQAAVNSTALYTRTEMRRLAELAEELIVVEDVKPGDALLTAASRLSASIKLGTYMTKVANAGSNVPSTLLEELFLLAYLTVEVDGLQSALSGDDDRKLGYYWQEYKAVVRDERIKGRLDEALSRP